MDFLERFEPKAVIKHFVNICNIPHPSGHEEGIREYIRKIADENGQEYFIDKGGNIIAVSYTHLKPFKAFLSVRIMYTVFGELLC